MLRVELEILTPSPQPHAGNGGLFTTQKSHSLRLLWFHLPRSVLLLGKKTTFRMCATHFQSQKSQFIFYFFMRPDLQRCCCFESQHNSMRPHEPGPRPARYTALQPFSATDWLNIPYTFCAAMVVYEAFFPPCKCVLTLSIAICNWLCKLVQPKLKWQY